MAVPAEFDGQSARTPSESITIPVQLPRISRRDLLRGSLLGGLILAGGGTAAALVRISVPNDEAASNAVALEVLDAIINHNSDKFEKLVAPSRLDRPGQDGLIITEYDKIRMSACARLTPKIENRKINATPEQRSVTLVYPTPCIIPLNTIGRSVQPKLTDTMVITLEHLQGNWSVVSYTR